MNLSQKIEAILFWKAEPVSIKKLSEMVSTTAEKISNDQIANALNELEKSLVGRGITLVRTNDEVMLGTSKDMSEIIEKLTKEELVRDLGKAGLETLSIILYQGPISRAEIDFIRGVNSQFILRNLLIRGLVERIENPDDARVFLYKTTLSLLSHLGISKIEELPEYEKVRTDIESFKNNQKENTEQDSKQDTTVAQ